MRSLHVIVFHGNSREATTDLRCLFPSHEQDGRNRGKFRVNLTFESLRWMHALE